MEGKFSNPNVDSYQARKDKLVTDLAGVAKDARDLAMDGVVQAQTTATDATRRSVDVANRFVHSNLWKTLGVVAVVGIVAGALLGRR